MTNSMQYSRMQDVCYVLVRAYNPAHVDNTKKEGFPRSSFLSHRTGLRTLETATPHILQIYIYMDYCVKCDVQMIHLESYDVCPLCGLTDPDEETLKNENDLNGLENASPE